MNTKEKHRKSRNVVLCRSSKKDPNIHGKEIQGLVFDHPSMPKIVTVSSVSRKTSSSKNPTGQRSPEQYLTRYRAPEQYPTGYRTPEQYPTGHRAPEQYPSRSSPPALIHTPSSPYSTGVQIPGGYRKSHGNLHSGPKTAERIAETSRPEAGRSQICFPSYYHQVSVPPRYPQHETPRTQQRRNSVGELRHHSEHVVQYSENGAQHLENSVHYLETLAREERAKKDNLGTDEFSRDFHLDIWRESHQRAVRNWNPPVCRAGQPPQTAGHNVDTSVPMARFRSLSTSAGNPPSLVLRGENLPHHVEQGVHLQQRSSHPPPSSQQGQYAKDLKSTMDVRRYSTGHPGLLHAEVCTTREFNPRVRSAEGTNSQVLSPENIRKSSNTTTEEYNPVVRSTEGTNSEILSAGNIRQSRRHEAEAQAAKMQQSHSPLPNTKRQKQQSTTVVVISDSDDDEESNISSPISNYDSDQDVFMVTKETRPSKRTVETDREESIVICGSLSSTNSPHESESDEACYITKVKRPGDNSDQSAQTNERVGDESQNQKSTGPSMTSLESCSYDVNNNEEPCHESGPNYRSVLYEREFSGHSGTQRVIMSERSFFDKATRGTKRTLEDKAQYFIAGAAESGVCALDAIARKIRRVSCDELESKNGKTRKTSDRGDLPVDISSNTCHQSSRDCVYSGENSKPKDRDDIPMLVRSRSENEEEISRQKGKIEPTCHLSSQDCVYSRKNSKPKDHDDMPKLIRSRSENDEEISRQKGKIERTFHKTSQDCVYSGENSKPKDHDDIPKLVRSRSENDEQISSPEGKIERSVSPTNDHRPSASQRQNTNDGTIGPLVEPGASSVTSRDEFRCHNCDRAPTEKASPGAEGSLTVLKLPKAGPKPTGIVVGVKQAPEAKQPLEPSTVGSGKPAKDSGIKCTDDVTCEDQKSKSGKAGRDLDILHSCDQVPLSQQWQAYTLKLEQERIAKNKIGNKPNEENGKRNSWEELKRKFETERKKFIKVHHGQNRTCSYTSFLEPRANATRVRSWNNVLGASCKSLKFHDATEILAEQYKRRKLSEESGSEVMTRSYTCNSDKNSNTTSNERQGRTREVTTARYVLGSMTKPTTSLPENCKLLLLTKSPTKTDTPPTKMEEAISGIHSREKLPLKTQKVNSSAMISSEVTPPELISSEVMSSEVRDSEQKSPELISELGPLEEKSSEVNTQEDDSSEIQPTDIRPSEVKPIGVASPGKDLQTEKNPLQQQEELSMQEWIKILQGRIAQVRESIDEETTPWKKKNKRKVLEKLEHNYDWMTGPYVDEAMFFSRRLQFFQTMRKQFELMKKIKNQRKVMKTTDSAPPQAKAAKEVTVSAKTKEITKEITKTKEVKKVKKTVKCKPKSVKNNGRGFMKKIRKAVLS